MEEDTCSHGYAGDGQISLFLACCPDGGYDPNPPLPPCSCFLGGTLITMADGSKIPIEEVKVDDRVLSFDSEKNAFVPDKVVQTFKHQASEYLIVNGHWKVTANHPVFNGKDWVEVGSLKIGDNLYNNQNQPEVIKTIVKIKEPVAVYNIEVNPVHTYIAGGYIVHNKAPTNCGDGNVGQDECTGACLCPWECGNCIPQCD